MITRNIQLNAAINSRHPSTSRVCICRTLPPVTIIRDQRTRLSLNLNLNPTWTLGTGSAVAVQSLAVWRWTVCSETNSEARERPRPTRSSADKSSWCFASSAFLRHPVITLLVCPVTCVLIHGPRDFREETRRDTLQRRQKYWHGTW